MVVFLSVALFFDKFLCKKPFGKRAFYFFCQCLILEVSPKESIVCTIFHEPFWLIVSYSLAANTEIDFRTASKQDNLESYASFSLSDLFCNFQYSVSKASPRQPKVLFPNSRYSRRLSTNLRLNFIKVCYVFLSLNLIKRLFLRLRLFLANYL